MIIIAGPCVIESEYGALYIAEEIKRISDKYGIDIIYKSSYDKANRSDIESYRGPGLSTGLKILNKVKTQTGLKITTDIHNISEISEVSNYVDVIQIPAFLSRQTDLLVESHKTGLPVNVKKGQFLTGEDAINIIKKAPGAWITERGNCFGNNTIVDFTNIMYMHDIGIEVIFDATHSVKNSLYSIRFAKAALATGCIRGLFFEVHDNPSNALCDGNKMISLYAFEKFIRENYA